MCSSVHIVRSENFKIGTENQSDTNHCVLIDFVGAVKVVEVNVLVGPTPDKNNCRLMIV